MGTRWAFLIAFTLAPALDGEWNPRRAAEYLDGRQQQWFAWPVATKGGAPCISCHTGVSYLLARPALRHALGESGATKYEDGLLAGVRERAGREDTTGTQAVLAALLLARQDAERGGELSAEAQRALDRMWSLQVTDGRNTGAWPWTELDLDPWETSDSAFYGASLAAAAVGTAPGGYQSRPEIRRNVEALRTYLRGARQDQPLHNRLILLWAASGMPDLLSAEERQAISAEAWQRQAADGGWTVAALGAWKPHPAAAPAPGSNAYATGFAASVLLRAGAPAGDPRMARALDWLESHQERESGYWDAVSMNKRYETGSMQSLFMRDAATAFATLALIEGRPVKPRP